ncbi:MAG TPA: TetR/AcrR family transcriptional regulator [Micromonosporaceae bacterium]
MARTVGSAADETRERILEVSVDLFIERGYPGTSIRDIAERLGRTKGSLYYHFASKEDILTALVTPMMADLDSLIEQAGTVDGPNRSELVAQLVDLLDKHGVLLRSLMADPSVLRGLAVRESMPARLVKVQRAVAGSDDPAALLRGRCVLGVIQAGAVAPRWEAVGDTTGAERRAAVIGKRLSPEDKQFVVDAALAVLDVSFPTAPHS